ncbi:hypothetical protein V1477_009288, partial [Vespula maculifrons]
YKANTVQRVTQWAHDRRRKCKAKYGVGCSVRKSSFRRAIFMLQSQREECFSNNQTTKILDHVTTYCPLQFLFVFVFHKATNNDRFHVREFPRLASRTSKLPSSPISFERTWTPLLQKLSIL